MALSAPVWSTEAGTERDATVFCPRLPKRAPERLLEGTTRLENAADLVLQEADL
jgi:hypothetical protein